VEQENIPVKAIEINYIDLSSKEQKEAVKQYWTVEKRDNPKYPISAVRKRISGCVGFIIGINQQGQMQDYKIISSYPKGMFDKNAAVVLKNWRWKATENNTDNQPVLTYLRLDFTVGRKHPNNPLYLENCP
jgi:TonB family protein